MVVAFGLRVYRLDAVGLEGDEAFSIQAAYSGLAGIIHMVSTVEPHPPLYYSFLRGWFTLTGTSEFALRYPSLIANVLTIAFLIKVANFFSWRHAGLVGAVLLTLNPYQVWYSQEARMYTPAALFGLIAIYSALLFLRGGKLRYLGLNTVFTVLCMYSHYYGIFLFVFTNLLLLSAMWRERRPGLDFYRWLGGQTIVALLYFPWLAYASDIALTYTPFKRGTIDLLSIVKEGLVNYSLGLSVPRDTGFVLSLGFLAVVIAGLWFAGQIRDKFPAWLKYSFVAGYLLAPLTLGFLVSLFRPMYQARYFMVSSPAFFLVLGLGLVGLYRRAPLLGLAAGLFVVSAQSYSLYNYYYDYAYVKTDFADAVAYIESHGQPGDAIVLDGWSQTFQFWYYDTLRIKDPLPSYLFPLAEANGWDLTPGKLDNIMAKHKGVWLLDYDVKAYDGDRLVENYLARTYYQSLYKQVGWNRVVYYTPAPSTPTRPIPFDVTCGQDASAKNLRIPTTSVRAGEILPLSVDWQATAAKVKDYSVSWRLLDSKGRTVLQRDSDPASGFSTTSNWTRGEELTDRYGMLIPVFLPPGQYALSIVPYDKGSGTACMLRQGDRQVPADTVQLARVEVLDAPPLGTIDEPSPAYKARFAIGELNLLGYDLNGKSFKPGDSISARLFWQATKDVARDYEVTARLLNEKGDSVQEVKASVGPRWFPTSHWPAGKIAADYIDLTVPFSASSGIYKLSLAVRADGLNESTVSSFPGMAVTSRVRVFNAPAIAYPTATDYGGVIELLGYDVQPAPDRPLAAGQELSLTLHWKSLKEVKDSYKVFTQLLGDDQKIYGQRDSIPLDGLAPTNEWAPGEIIRDNYRLPVQPGAPNGKYRLVVGLYEPVTGRRIPLANGAGDAFVAAVFDTAGPVTRP
ncbi:MAG: glycosyltransferase family 39 protein [Dehalococcoidia bacterium]|nr:glycosyltransferase family 39 protein [Dehalococcoidia bacterium]